MKPSLALSDSAMDKLRSSALWPGPGAKTWPPRMSPLSARAICSKETTAFTVEVIEASSL